MVSLYLQYPRLVVPQPDIFRESLTECIFFKSVGCTLVLATLFFEPYRTSCILFEMF